MSTLKLSGMVHMPKSGMPGKPVAYMFGDHRLGLSRREAYAFSNIESGIALPEDRATMQTWLVKMTLLHGSWVSDEIGPFQT